ncbi:MAG: thrombospondin type 3 repeat-containing protein [Opitutales bacterium]|nr:thrombospondin type 3 repeat-containing protein [Opitutales bacterium]
MKTNLARHFGRSIGIALIAAAPAAIAAPVGVADDFESYTSGATPLVADWSTTYQADPSDQQNLFTVEDALGEGGSKGYSLDVLTAEQSYKSLRQIGATGDVVIVEADFQIAIDGTLLTDTPSGVNKGILGLEISNTPTWFDGNGFTVALARRDNDFWGLSLNAAPFIEGFENNTALGLPPRAGEGLAAPAGTSDWFTVSLALTDTGAASPASGWTCVATVTNRSTGAVVFTSPSWDLPNTILAGSTLYGGLTSPFSGYTGDKVNTVGKVSAATADNFSIFGYSSSIDADGDGLTELEEGLLGTSDSDSDSDDDGYSDKFEDDNGYDPLDANSNPLVTLYADFSEANGYVDGNLSGQEGWLGQTNTQVDATAGTISNTGAGYIRTVHGNGVLGSTGGNPATATGTFATGDVISIDYDYQFTLPPAVNSNMVVAGFRGETASDSKPKQGFKLAYNQFSAATGGNIKFWPDLADTVNGDALIIDGSLFGLNGAGDPGVGTGAVDLESDDIRISYLAECTDAGTNAWEVTGFTVTNLTTSQTWSYSGPTQTFTYDDDGATVPATPTEAFFAQQLAPNGQATFTGSSSRVVLKYATSGVDADMDGLSQAEELALGTSDGNDDTDGDTFSDFAEVNAAPTTDPLDANSYTDAPLRSEVDFNDYALGTPSGTLWSTKWSGAPTTSQQNLWAVEAANGVDGSQGYALDVTTAWRNYHTINQASVTGDVLTLSGDVRFSTTGAPLNEEPAPGINGVNDGFIGLVVTTEPAWWQVNNTNGGFTFQVARRADDNWGVFVNGSVEAWLSNADIGLAGGLTASESDWFTLSAQIAPNAGGTAYEIVCTVSYQGTPLHTTAAIELDNVVFPIGGAMYGGFSTGYNNDPSNTGSPLIGSDTVSFMPVGNIAKVASVDMDNFSLVGYSDSIDIDMDNLSQSEEFLLGTSDLNTDTDGDSYNDDTEVNAGTDPLNPLDFPVGTPVDPQVGSFGFTGGDTVTIAFTGEASTVYKLTHTVDLATSFVWVMDTPATDGSGNGSVTYVIPDPVPANSFFRIEE